MKKQQSTMAALVVAWLLTVAFPAGAALVTFGTADINGAGTGYNLIYDRDSPFGPIVWLDFTSRWDEWGNQVSWASGLNGEGMVTYHLNPGISVNWDGSWRLPTTVDADSSWGSTPPSNSSELAHLYYAELGNIGYPDSGWGLINTGDFNNLINWNWYWSGTEYAKYTGAAWGFSYYDGFQIARPKYDYVYALAVRPGQVVATPEPSTLLLVGGGLAALVVARRRRFNR